MLGWIALVAVSAIVGACVYHSFAIRRQARRKIKEVFRSAKPVLYRQSNRGITVLVRADDHAKTKEEYEAAVISGKRKPWEEIRFVVTPAFTFCNESCDRKFTRTGNLHDLEAIVEKTIVRATGLTRDDFARAGYEYPMRERDELAKLLIPESPFLFVPFSSSEIEYKAQGALFLHKTLAEAWEYLLHQQYPN